MDLDAEVVRGSGHFLLRFVHNDVPVLFTGPLNENKLNRELPEDRAFAQKLAVAPQMARAVEFAERELAAALPWLLVLSLESMAPDEAVARLAGLTEAWAALARVREGLRDTACGNERRLWVVPPLRQATFS